MTESNIPEPIRTHLDHCEGLISCVDKNLTYRTKRALRCGADFLQEASLAWLAHRKIEAGDDPLESFVQHAGKQATKLVDAIRQSLEDFDSHPPVHPYQCTKPELQQEIDRHHRLTRAMSNLQENIEHRMEAYIPCKKGDWIMTGHGMGMVRGVEGCTVHTFIPERWETGDAFIAVPAVYLRVDPVPQPDGDDPPNPAIYYLNDSWQWLNFALAWLDDERRDGSKFVLAARTAIQHAFMAWISSRSLWMEKYNHLGPDGAIEALKRFDAPDFLIEALCKAQDSLDVFAADLEHGKVHSLSGLPSTTTAAMDDTLDVFNIIASEFSYQPTMPDDESEDPMIAMYLDDND